MDRITHLQNELKASEARFFNVVDISPDSLVVIDKNGIICFVNNSCQILFGRNKDDLIGRQFGFPVVSGDNTQIEILHAHKKTVIAEMRVVEIRWDKHDAYLASLRDISEQVRLENELTHSNEELIQFAYAVSHDIKAPLRNIESIATWLLEDYSAVLDDNATHDLTLMNDNIARMQRLVDGLLQFTQIGTFTHNQSLVDLNLIFEEVLDNIKTDIDSKKAEIIIHELPSITANGILLVLLFQNLISNSIKYSGDNIPKISVSAISGETQWEISITDNGIGIGIDEQYWKKIFTSFERLHTQAEYAGSGIGLATCAKIVKLHNGAIRVDSKPEMGSIFYVSLPITGESVSS